MYNIIGYGGSKLYVLQLGVHRPQRRHSSKHCEHLNASSRGVYTFIGYQSILSGIAGAEIGIMRFVASVSRTRSSSLAQRVRNREHYWPARYACWCECSPRCRCKAQADSRSYTYLSYVLQQCIGLSGGGLPTC
jgi:hypothetical protein